MDENEYEVTVIQSDNSAVIFDIQRFSLHDGPGIRTAVFFKGCPLSCMWCQNPESIKKTPEIAFYAEYCKSCFECQAACPEGAVTDGLKNRIDYSKCNACGDCVNRCVYQGLRLIGRRWDCDSLFKEILKDKEFFIDSSGGVTLTGGEPMIYSDFLEVFLPLIKAQNIHINIETSGFFNWDQMEKILPHFDLIYFDLKLMDGIAHKKYTGCDNSLILNNFSALSKRIECLQARMPIIPGVNDDRDNIIAVAKFLAENGHNTIHCLPYHNLGEAKRERIGGLSNPLPLKLAQGGDLHQTRKYFSEEGIDALIYG